MNIEKRKRASVSKLQKAQTAAGTEYYYSKKPDSRKSDYAVEKTKALKARAIAVKKK